MTHAELIAECNRLRWLLAAAKDVVRHTTHEQRLGDKSHRAINILQQAIAAAEEPKP